MKKFILTVFLCFALCLGISSPLATTFADEIASVTVLVPTAIYSEADIKSEILVEKVDTGTKLTLDNTSEQNSDMFYRVYIYGIAPNASENDVGYVLRAQTLDSTITSPLKTLDDNATIKNDDTKTYSYDVNTKKYIEENIVLKKGTPVQVLDGYDKNKDFTYIAFYDSNNNIVRFYVETSNLRVPGINWSVIVAISTLITCATILAIIFGIKGRKKKKERTK